MERERPVPGIASAWRAPRRLEKDARRRQLVDAAIHVFARDGYWAADVSVIVAAAGVTRGTFYLYFQAKRDVFLAVIERYRALQGRQVVPAGLPLPEQLTHAFAQTLRLHAEHRDLALVMLRESGTADPEIAAEVRAAGERARAQLAAVYERLMVAGRLRAADPLLIATAVSGLLREALLHRVLLVEPPVDIDGIARELAALVYRGLRPGD